MAVNAPKKSTLSFKIIRLPSLLNSYLTLPPHPGVSSCIEKTEATTYTFKIKCIGVILATY